tara:strand:- start:3662 stop:5032 length:1371 start_codon:yes stop_codon:yes gene_type:complete
MFNFGKSVNRILIPDLSEQAVLSSVVDAGQNYLAQKNYDMMESLDFYYNQNLDKHIEQWFASESLSQVPPFIGSCVPRFAKARMMIYKENAKRLIAGEVNDDYNQLTYRINTKTREFSELAWLLGCCYMKSMYNERKNRLEYEILPNVQEYYVRGETEPFAYSYEIENVDPTKKRFVFWSEERDGVQGMHFEYDEKGYRFAVKENSEMINPYGIVPISKVAFSKASYDVTRAGLHIAIAMTEIALSVRFRLGQPVFTGLEEGQSKLSAGIDNAYILPEGATFNYVAPGGSLIELIEATKSMANQVAENNQLRIRWGESGGNAPSGEALRIMEIENLEARKSDEAIFREFEHDRYEIDRRILEVHNILTLSEEYAVDFGEVTFPMSPKEEREMLSWKLDNNIISQKDLLLYYNPDMSEEELEMKMSGIMQENQTVANSQQPQSSFQRILNGASPTSS